MSDMMMELLGKAKMAADMYKIGQITREAAVEAIRPYEEEFNKKSAEIAKKYNRKPKKFSIAGFLR